MATGWLCQLERARRPGPGRTLARLAMAVLVAAVLSGPTVRVSTASASPPSAPASPAPVPGMNVFVPGTDGAIWFKGWDGAAWSGWSSLGGPFTGAPAVASWGPGRVDVFTTGLDQQLWHRWFAGGGWSGWESLGGALTSAPAVAAWGPNRLDVFARGTDNAMVHRWWDGAAWSVGWESLGGVLTSAPAVAAWGPNRLDVFVRGTDNAMAHRWWDGAAWSAGWESLGGVLTSAPAVAAWGPNRLDVFVRGTDNAAAHRWWNGAAWLGWDSLGGVLTTGPGAASWGPGQLDVFVGGTDNNGAWHRHYGGAGWDSGWQSRGGVITDAPAATSWTAVTNVIPGVPYHAQVYALSCESAALQMVLARQGVNVTQAQILQALGVDARRGVVDSNGVLHWGNPNAVFVGDVNASEVALTGYGTYAPPIARVAAGYGLNVIASGEGIAPQDLYHAVLTSHPAVAWISFDYRFHPAGRLLTWDGQWVQYEGPIEHAVTVVGVNQDSVLIDNPWPSLGQSWVSKSVFEAAYGTYHDMAVVLQ
jgi:uncharacterized protein YvpB